jgi:hypothetical protein
MSSEPFGARKKTTTVSLRLAWAFPLLTWAPCCSHLRHHPVHRLHGWKVLPDSRFIWMHGFGVHLLCWCLLHLALM